MLVTKRSKMPKTFLKMTNIMMMAHKVPNVMDPTTGVPRALKAPMVMPMTKRVVTAMAMVMVSKPTREDAVDLKTGNLLRRATLEEGLMIEEATRTTEMLTRIHSHKYISLVLRRKLVKRI